MATQGKKLTKLVEDKILSEKLINPEASLRDIAGKSDVSYQTVSNVLEESSELLTSIDTGGRTDIVLNTLDSIIENGNKIIDRFIRMAEGQEDEMLPIKSYNDLTAISGIQERSWKQRQIISGDVTDRIAVEDLSSLSPKQLEAERSKLL